MSFHSLTFSIIKYKIGLGKRIEVMDSGIHDE